MSYKDRIPPLRGMTDIPIQRDSVGAMGLMGNQMPNTERLYVYRGTGVDQLAPVPEPPKPKPKPKRRKPRPRSSPAVDFVLAMEAAQRAREVLAEAEREPEPEPEPDPVRSVKVRRRTTSITPSPDWQPSTGADIDEWLAELDEA